MSDAGPDSLNDETSRAHSRPQRRRRGRKDKAAATKTTWKTATNREEHSTATRRSVAASVAADGRRGKESEGRRRHSDGSKCAPRSESRDLHVNTTVISGREVRDLNPFNEILVGLELHLDVAAAPPLPPSQPDYPSLLWILDAPVDAKETEKKRNVPK